MTAGPFASGLTTKRLKSGDGKKGF